MQKQNFENKVQQKMEELSFTPSVPVWQKVEEELKKKRERRRILVWMLPLLLLCIGFIWLSVENQKSPVNTVKKERTIKESNSYTTSLKPGAPIFNASPNNNSSTSSTVTEGNRSTLSKNKSEKNGRIKLPTILQNNPVEIATSNTYISFRAKNRNHANIVFKSKFNQTNTVLNTTDTIQTNTTVEPVVANPLNNPPVQSDSAANVLQDTTAMITTLTKKDSVAPKPQQQKNWNIAFQASFGISGIKTATGSSLYYSSVVPVSVQTGPGGYSPSEPSKATTGFSFTAGIGVNKRLTTKSFFLAGLQYHYYSTYNKVGQKVIDSSGGSSNSFADMRTAYTNSQHSNTYHNEYHFIELPVGVGYSFFKQKLQAEGGLTLARLLASNALQYNSDYKIYRQDNSLLRKTQWSLFGSVTYRAAKFAKWNFSAGPAVQYGLTNLQKNSSVKQHFFFGGIKILFSF